MTISSRLFPLLLLASCGGAGPCLDPPPYEVQIIQTDEGDALVAVYVDEPVDYQADVEVIDEHTIEVRMTWRRGACVVETTEVLRDE